MSHFLYFVRHGEQQDAEHGMPGWPAAPAAASGKRRRSRSDWAVFRSPGRGILRCSARRRPRTS